MEIASREHSVATICESESGRLQTNTLISNAAETVTTEDSSFRAATSKVQVLYSCMLSAMDLLPSSKQDRSPGQKSVHVFRIYHETGYLISGRGLESCKHKTKVWDFMLS